MSCRIIKEDRIHVDVTITKCVSSMGIEYYELECYGIKIQLSRYERLEAIFDKIKEIER